MEATEKFREGIAHFMKKADIGDPAFEQTVLGAIKEAVDAAVQSLEAAGVSTKVAADENLSALAQYIRREATRALLEKSGVLREEACTTARGVAGSWALYSSDGSKQLGCHGSREAALAQERAIQISKHADTEKV